MPELDEVTDEELCAILDSWRGTDAGWEASRRIRRLLDMRERVLSLQRWKLGGTFNLPHPEGSWVSWDGVVEALSYDAAPEPQS